jgi:hypothetical protein
MTSGANIVITSTAVIGIAALAVLVVTIIAIVRIATG